MHEIEEMPLQTVEIAMTDPRLAPLRLEQASVTNILATNLSLTRL